MRWIRSGLAALGICLLAITLGVAVSVNPWAALGLGIVEIGGMIAVVQHIEMVRVGAFLTAGGFAGWAFTSDSTLFGSSFADGSVAASPAKQIPVVVMVLGLILCWLPLDGRQEIMSRFRGHPATRALGYYVLAVLVATAFSPIHGIAYLRAAQMLIPVGAALAISRRTAHMAAILTIIACVVHSSLGILFPQEVNGGFGVERVSGYLQVNTYAFAGAVAAVTGIWYWVHKQQRTVAVLLLVVGITAIMTARSRTALVAGAIAIAITIYACRKAGDRRDPWLIRITQITLTGAVILACWPGGIFAQEGGLLGTYFARGNASDVMTFTGRERLWAYAIRVGSERPIVGYGPGSLRAGTYAEQMKAYLGYGGQGHNAAVGAFFESGLIGVVAWFGLMIFTLTAILRSRHTSRPLLLGLYFLIAASSMTEAGPSGFGLFWAMLLGLAIAAAGTNPSGTGARLRRGQRGHGPGRPLVLQGAALDVDSPTAHRGGR
jgi:O-antigen ligase